MCIVLFFLHLYSEACLHACAVYLVCKVEVWLNRLLDTMRSTVRHEITEAVLAYEDKPREQWLFDYPAQVNCWLYCMDLMENTHFGGVPIPSGGLICHHTDSCHYGGHALEMFH